ncbi:MAG: CoA pyrophosphatase [Acidobacteria bacterium]|nr:CoA pyrophosphatase [Acidobacteriota bacterium]
MGSLTVPVESPKLYQIDALLRSAFRAPLPGGDAHRRLAPKPRPGWRPGVVPDHATPAAALVLLYPLDDAPHVLLTVRAGRLGKHAGQVSFPGGLIDAGESVRDAALREAFEEVGLDPAAVRVAGALSPLYITVSNFAIHPVAGVAASTPRLRPSAAEVARLLPAPLAALADPANLRRGTRWRGDLPCDVPYFEVRNERVWGATAMVLAELLTLLDLAPRNPW